MFVVLFEVEPKAERWDDYLRHAGALRPELLKIEGFLDNRRFTSRRRTGVLLSLSFWRDEKSLIRWRTHGGHHLVQLAGRNEVFRDYHLRVGEVVRDNDAASPRTRFEETETGLARAVSVIEQPSGETPPEADGLVDWDILDGITVPDVNLMLLNWRDAPSMAAWTPAGGSRRTDVVIVRDYGLRAREEAPQYYPPVLPAG